LVYLILRALSPIKVYDRKINISSLVSSPSDQFEEALDCRASRERKNKPSRTTTTNPTTLRTAVCIFDSQVAQNYPVFLAATRSSHTATLQNATFPTQTSLQQARFGTTLET
jgi:hypothetical protein